jgi:hypothetical protein
MDRKDFFISKKERPKARTKPQKDEVREERITMEIVVDAY